MTAARERYDVFRAVADPTRRAILDRLRAGPTPVNALAADFQQTRPAISKHLRVLERAGLISRGRDAQRRPRRIEAQPLADASGWLETYRRIWEGNYQRLDALLDQLKVAESSSGRRKADRENKERSRK